MRGTSSILLCGCLALCTTATDATAQCCIGPMAGYNAPFNINMVKPKLNGFPAGFDSALSSASNLWNASSCNAWYNFPYFNPSAPAGGYNYLLNLYWQATATGVCTLGNCGFFNAPSKTITICDNTTNASGATIDCGPSSVYPTLIAHEIGHYLGISHTTSSCPTPCLMNAVAAQQPPSQQECSLADEMVATYEEVNPPPDPSCQAYCPSTCIGTHCPESPILIDLADDTFKLTGLDNGISFDLDANGTPELLGWTKGGARRGDGFLVMDRNGDSVVNNGSEMFGNFTPTPDGSTPLTGFDALAVFDSLDWGGNGDGVIDSDDEIFSTLLVWIDSNHNGVSEAWELFGLPQVGLERLGLAYTYEHQVDPFGNLMFYWSWAQQTVHGRTRIIPTVDVFFAHD